MFLIKINLLISTVWLDVRTTSTVDEVLADVRDHNQDCLKSLCGLPVSTYFSAVKVRWLMDNVPEVKHAIEKKRCCFGTMDTWLLWVRCTLESKNRHNKDK
jgi:glycerol kinase